jgi:hypothetical protein
MLVQGKISPALVQFVAHLMSFYNIGYTGEAISFSTRTVRAAKFTKVEILAGDLRNTSCTVLS